MIYCCHPFPHPDRPISHASTEGSSGMSSPPAFEAHSSPNPSQPEEEQEEGGFTVPDEDEILKLTMGVVKTVKELSNKVHKSKPGDYVDLVKVSGNALEQCWKKNALAFQIGRVDAFQGVNSV